MVLERNAKIAKMLVSGPAMNHRRVTNILVGGASRRLDPREQRRYLAKKRSALGIEMSAGNCGALVVVAEEFATRLGRAVGGVEGANAGERGCGLGDRQLLR
jgi:hypothetical protein